jgi:colanic acid biosynthesis glycosyl transferase WcaI
MQVWRCPLWIPAQPGGLKRLLHLASFSLSSLPVMLRQITWRPDVVWVVEPALFCAPAAVAVARLSGAQAWLHVQDFEVDAAFALGLLRGSFLRRMVTGAERWLMRRFDVVSTISQHMHQRLLDKGVAPERAVLAPNWVDISAITPGGGDLDMDCRASLAMTKVGAMTGSFREVLGIPPDAVVALYSGNMGAKQGLELLADLARLCLEDSASNTPLEHKQRAKAAIIFVFCGNGAGRADLVQRCAGLPNVHFLDLQPIERLNELLAMADIHLLPQRADAADLVMPSKLTGMLASGRPVVATALSATELGRVVAGEGCGLVVPPGDAQAFADALQTLASSPEVRKQMGRAGRSYAETHLDRDAILQQFEARLMHGRRSTFKNAS